MKKINEYERELDNYKKETKKKIKEEPSRFKRFFKYLWYLFTITWKYVLITVKDFRTFLIFLIVAGIVSIEVWLPLLLGTIFQNDKLIHIGLICEAFWLGPFTPFIGLCLVLTFLIRGLLDKIKLKRSIKKQ